MDVDCDAHELSAICADHLEQRIKPDHPAYFVTVGVAYKGMGTKSGKAWIVNEAHGLRGPIVSRFLTLIEDMPDHCSQMFTTTRRPQTSLFADHDDADPFFSRCLRVPLAWHEHAPNVAGPLTKAFAERRGRSPRKRTSMAVRCRHTYSSLWISIGATTIDE